MRVPRLDDVSEASSIAGPFGLRAWAKVLPRVGAVSAMPARRCYPSSTAYRTRTWAPQMWRPLCFPRPDA